MLRDDAREGRPAEHARDLGDAVVALQHADRGARAAAGDGLRHGEVPVAPHRALRQVGDRDHLVVSAHGAQTLAHGAPHFAADVGVDLVEHEHGNRVVFGAHGLHREHHARDLARGGDVAERTRRLAGVRLEAELDRVATTRVRRARREGHAESGLEKAESVQFLRDGLRKTLCRLAAIGAKRSARLRDGRFGGGDGVRQLADASIAPFQVRETRRARIAQFEERGNRGAIVLALEALDERKAVVERLKRLGVRIEAAHGVLHAAREFLHAHGDGLQFLAPLLRGLVVLRHLGETRPG